MTRPNHLFLWYLKSKSGVYGTIAKKQPPQLPNTNREFFPSCDICNWDKHVKEFP